MALLPPAPVDAPFGSYNWADWYKKVRDAINAATSIAWTIITGTPTTVAGYGITDAVTLTGVQTVTNKTLTSPKIDIAVFDKASGQGIKVDTTTPTFGWRDILGAVEVRGIGAADPTYSIYGATAIRQYEFSATVMKEVFIVFHVPHDYVPGTDIHFHAHWSNAAAVPNTGSVIWGFEYTFAKGFNQAAFPASATVTVSQNSSGTRYQHMIAETAAITMSGLEVDSIILVRAYRDAATDTCTDAVYLHTADIHYQSTSIATKQKSPNFYS